MAQVTSEQATTNVESYKRVMSVQELPILDVEPIPDDETFYSEWQNIIPRKDFGLLPLLTSPDSFVEEWQSALKAGSMGTLSSVNRNDVYVSLRPDSSGLSEKDASVWTNHSAEAFDTRSPQIATFLQELKGSNLPQVYKDQYVDKANDVETLRKLAVALGTPEFTRLQKTPEEWAGLVDLTASVQQGEIVLKYEVQAKALLAQIHSQEQTHISLSDALQAWQLSEDEMQTLNANEPIIENQVDLSPTQTSNLFQVMLDRLGLGNSWHISIKANTVAISVNAKAKQIIIPDNRRLSPDEIPYIPAHEMVHVVRGENGSRQGCKLLSEGMKGYLESEEGAATIAEMIMGEPFGHARQRTFAARYLAVSMALKAEVVDGRSVPKFTTQEIYDTLINYDIDPEEASKIMWRINRGTSLRHEGLELTVSDGTTEHILPAAESFAKDAVYFSGMMQIFDWVKSTMPLMEGQRASVTTQSPDFSVDLLRRVGYAAWRLGRNEPITFNDLRANYHQFASLGREALVEILNFLLVGKVTHEAVTDPLNAWGPYIKRAGLVNYKDILGRNEVQEEVGD